MARNYLQEASGFFKDSVALTTLVETDPHGVVSKLLGAIAKADGMMGPTVRKAAAYALGQVGEPGSAKQLRDFCNRESVESVRIAMRASLTAIKLAPAATHSQSQRCEIIGDVYDGRRPANWE
jgi:hypothetical protein